MGVIVWFDVMISFWSVPYISADVQICLISGRVVCSTVGGYGIMLLGSLVSVMLD